MGKPLAEADSEVFRGLDSIHAACSIGPEMAGMYLGSDPTIVQTFYEPVVGFLPADAVKGTQLTWLIGRLCLNHRVQLPVYDSPMVYPLRFDYR